MLDHGIEHDQELAHASRERHLLRFPNSTQALILETAVETHIQAQGTESKDFSTAPQFTKTVNSSMASSG